MSPSYQSMFEMQEIMFWGLDKLRSRIKSNIIYIFIYVQTKTWLIARVAGSSAYYTLRPLQWTGAADIQ